MNKQIIYLACPYSHESREVRLARFHAANLAAGKLMEKGHIVFSPISHTHPIAEACALPLGWEFWRHFDESYLSISAGLFVLCIDGWRESAGVTAEIAIASQLGLPIKYIQPC